MTPDDRMPATLGPYRLLDRIGEGGMGVVYLARDAEHRSVAIKVLRPAVAGDPNARRPLAREVETMRLVRSPFVAEVIDTDVTGDRPYIVTQYVPGRTLDEVVQEEGPVQGAVLARLACGLANAPGPVLPLRRAALGREPSRRPSAEQLGAAAAALDPSTLMSSAAPGAGSEMAPAMTAAGTRRDGPPLGTPGLGAIAGAGLAAGEKIGPGSAAAGFAGPGST